MFCFDMLGWVDVLNLNKNKVYQSMTINIKSNNLVLIEKKNNNKKKPTHPHKIKAFWFLRSLSQSSHTDWYPVSVGLLSPLVSHTCVLKVNIHRHTYNTDGWPQQKRCCVSPWHETNAGTSRIRIKQKSYTGFPSVAAVVMETWQVCCNNELIQAVCVGARTFTHVCVCVCVCVCVRVWAKGSTSSKWGQFTLYVARNSKILYHCVHSPQVS